MTTRVTTYYLEMIDPSQLRPARTTGELEVRRAELPCPELNRFLYTAVGGDWFWIDRLPWSYDQWKRYLDRPELETWVGYHRGTPVGYFELESLPESGVELVYFGLLPAFVGRGFGGELLTTAVRRAWQLQPRRVWLHTCTLDHPQAVANYEARGFVLCREVVTEAALPESSPGPWSGPTRRD